LETYFTAFFGIGKTQNRLATRQQIYSLSTATTNIPPIPLFLFYPENNNK